MKQNTVWTILEFQHEQNPYYAGPTHLCRYEICRTKPTVEKLLKEWTATQIINGRPYEFKIDIIDGETVHFCPDYSIIYVKEKLIND